MRCSDNASEIAGFSGLAEKGSPGYGRAMILDLVSARECRGERGRKRELCTGIEELRRELIGIKRLAADVEGELLVWAPEGRAARPEFTALLQPLPALRHADKPTAPATAPAAAPITVPLGSSAPVA